MNKFSLVFGMLLGLSNYGFALNSFTCSPSTAYVCADGACEITKVDFAKVDYNSATNILSGCLGTACYEGTAQVFEGVDSSVEVFTNAVAVSGDTQADSLRLLLHLNADASSGRVVVNGNVYEGVCQ